MKIIDVNVICLRTPAYNEECEWGEDAVIVKITTDLGITGIGESDSSPQSVDAFINAPNSNMYCGGIKRLLLNENPLEMGRLWNKIYWETNYSGRRGLGIHAMSAVDIALWDIASQYYKKPIHILLGGKYRDKIRVYGTFIPSSKAGENADIAMKLKDEGFTSIKFGGGILGDEQKTDIQIVKEVRKALGDDFELEIDLAAKWRTCGYASEMFGHMEEFNLNWIEEPVLADIPESYARLSQTSKIKIAGGESLTTQYEFNNFMNVAVPDIVQPDITRCGGFTEIMKINNLAELKGIRLVPHGFSTGVLLAATIQFLAAAQYGDLMEYSVSKSPLFKKLVKNMPVLEDGYVKVPDCIGLGVELDEDIINKYRVI